MSTAAQKKALKDFKSVTGANDKVATAALTKTSWNLERAIDAFFNKPGGAGAEKKTDTSKLSKIFDKYAGSTDKDKDVMYDEKLASFFKDVGLDPEGGVTLGIAWKLKAKTLGEISRTEFTTGFGGMGVDSLDGIKAQVKDIQRALDNKAEFKDFYRWLFDFIKEEGERKTIDVAVATEFWNLTMTKHFPLLPKWIKFLEKQGSKTVSQDLWVMTYEFARDVKADLSNYDPDGAWPAIIDDFVAYVKEESKPKDD